MEVFVRRALLRNGAAAAAAAFSVFLTTRRALVMTSEPTLLRESERDEWIETTEPVSLVASSDGIDGGRVDGGEGGRVDGRDAGPLAQSSIVVKIDGAIMHGLEV